MTDDHRISEPLIVTTKQTVNGMLTAGATVRDGGQLTVQGAVDGPLFVEAGSGLQVNGALNCDPDSAIHGVLGVAGVINGGVTDTIRDGAHLVIAVGTIVNDGSGTHAVQADGSLQELHGRIKNLSIDGGHTVTFERDGGGLSPI